MTDGRGVQDIAAPGAKLQGQFLVELRHEVASLLGRKHIGFPGAQPVSFARRHIEELTRQDYYVCEKSDGFRYLLYCTRDGNGNELHYLIDRKNDYWHVPGLHFPIVDDEINFHADTLIDGELVLDKTPNHQIQAKYLVFDCIVLDGSSLMSRTLDKRIAYFKERVFTPYQGLYKKYPEEIQHLPFVVELKQMQVAYGIEMMFRQILPNLPHGNDGLIFTCRNTNYKHGTDQHILKWKPENENSVDFRMEFEFVVVQPDALDIAHGNTAPYYDYDLMPVVNLLAGGSNDTDTWYATLHLEDAEWEALKELKQPLDDRIVECYMDASKRWRYMRFRDDKERPNHISTVESVIESIRDRVTERELIVSSKRIRDEWKRREAKTKEESARAQAGAKRKADEQGPGRPSPGPPAKSEA